MLLQVLYSVRSERQLMEQTQYNLLYRWFIGLAMDDAPHVAQNTSGRKSAVPDSIAQSVGYVISQQKRKRIEQGFGWAKVIGNVRQVMVALLLKNESLAECFNTSKERRHDEDGEGALHRRCWWVNSAKRINRVMPIAYLDRLGVPRLS